MIKSIKYISIFIVMICFALPVHAEVYTVSSESQLEGAVASVLPGDTVLLAAQSWNNVELEFIGEGTEKLPIVFGAETPGKTILTGNSRIEISGNWLVVRDLVFQDGNITDEGSIIAFRTNSSTFAHNCRVTNVSIEDYNPEDSSLDTKYVSLYGTYNRVDHCSLSGKTNSGATLVVWLDETPDYHLIDHNYFGPRQDLGVNGGETIRIGTSDWESYNSNCVVEYNLFDECDGEIEIISNKSVGNHYRYNTFTHCEGTLTLRHGSDCRVYGNFFFGDNQKNCGGIRVIGPGHRVFNNYLENLEGTSYRAAICLMNGVPNSPANRYRQVDDAQVGFNTIINCKEPFAIGAGVSDELSLTPINSQIENNLIVSRSGRKLVNEYSSAEGVTWRAVYTDAEDIGISADGFVQTELPMENDGQMYRPSSTNPVLGAALEGAFDTLLVDIDGQTRPETGKDVGCDQYSTDEETIFPLSRDEVGANFDVATSSAIIEVPDYSVVLNDGKLKMGFADEAERMVSIFSADGKLLSRFQVQTQSFEKQVGHLPHFFIVNIQEINNQYAIKLIQ